MIDTLTTRIVISETSILHPIFHSYPADSLYVGGGRYISGRKRLLSHVTILKLWSLGAKVEDMEDIL
jgi:hypothetical protein